MSDAHEEKLIRDLYHLAQDIDVHFGDIDHAQRLESLRSSLKALLSYPNPRLQQLSRLATKLHLHIDARHFLGILVAIERQMNIAVRDADLRIATTDRIEHQNTLRRPVIFILDQIRSAFNVGAMLRTADCLGVEKVYLCGYTATPENPKTLKSSMGSEKYVSWEWKKSTLEALTEARKENYRILALETVAGARDIVRTPIQGKLAFVCGNERYGLDSRILQACDEVISIPVFGVKNSLNVATAMAIAAYSCLGSEAVS